MECRTNRALFLVECLDLPAAAEIDGITWEPFQTSLLNDDSLLRIEDKSRQIAWSFTVAAEAVANAVLDTAESTIFVSINQDEAAEKTRYAKRVLENLDIGGLPRLKVDNVFGLEFDNGARIISLPSRPPRGKAKMHVVLDEFAHVIHDRQIYVAAMPIISKGGRLRIGSSPMGAVGVHWEISQQELRPYPGYTRVQTPWWKVRAFCRGRRLYCDPSGQFKAAAMETKERVGRYGNERIQLIFGNMLLDDFQQEYECVVVDESVSYFTWELIRKNQDENLRYWHVKSVDAIDVALVGVLDGVASGVIEPALVGGVDIGRKKNLTEVVLMGAHSRAVALMISLDRVEFDNQEQLLRTLLQTLPVESMLIDQNGIGMHLAENLGRDTVAQGVTFTNASKALWVTELKIQMERSKVPLPVDRDLAYQIHSIKRRVTSAKNVVYDTEANEKHHADKLWALALAVWAAREFGDRPTWGTVPGWRRS